MNRTDLKPLGVGIVGYGQFGRFLHRAWGEAVKAVCDQREIVPFPGGVRFHRRLEDLLGEREVEIVAIATEPHTHAAIAREAVAAGRHVILEKPLATTLADADALITAAHPTNRMVTVDYVLRRHPLITALGDMLGAGVLGEVRTVLVTNLARADHLPADHWFWDERRSGGILVEHGVHFFDLADHLLGERPLETIGFLRRRPDGLIDQRSATVAYPSGAVAHHLHGFCRSEPGETTTVEIGLDHATVRLEGWIPLQGEVWVDPMVGEVDPLVSRLPNPREVEDARFRFRRFRFGLNASKEEVYLSCLREVLSWTVEAIRGGGAPEVTLDDGRVSLATAVTATLDADGREGAFGDGRA